jgi:hypothetical protein
MKLISMPSSMHTSHLTFSFLSLFLYLLSLSFSFLYRDIAVALAAIAAIGPATLASPRT